MVAVFISQNDDTDSLVEKLELRKGFKPDWKPNNFSVDFSFGEIGVIEK